MHLQTLRCVYRIRVFLITILALAIGLAGCEDTDIRLAADAGIEAYKAATLSDATVVRLSRQSAQYMDGQHTIALPDSRYAKRLQALVGDLHEQDGFTFNYKVYLQNDVNAFALADGSIRIFSGLMDMLHDGELRFVFGHEMGHVVKQHMLGRLRLAYAASALRKGIAAQNSITGEIARSHLGGLVQMLMGAQFSQLEEKVADDYGLSFLQSQGYAPEDAVSALEKLAALGRGHSFLSSHPDPEVRAARISLQVQGKAASLEETGQGFVNKIKAKFGFMKTISAKQAVWFPAIFGSSGKN